MEYVDVRPNKEMIDLHSIEMLGTINMSITYNFQPKWKEELICMGPMGEFTLEFPMGIPTVYIPNLDSWEKKFPNYDYLEFKNALVAWCNENKLAHSMNGNIY